MKYALAVIAVTALIASVAGCGGSEGTGRSQSVPAGRAASAAGTASAPARTQPSTTTTTGAGSAPPLSSSSSPPGAPRAGSSEEELPPPRRERHPRGDNSIQSYGHAGSGSDRVQISHAVTSFYAAVAADDGAAACSQLAGAVGKTMLQIFTRTPQLRGKSCGDILGQLFKRRPGVSSADLTDVRVTSVRVKGDKAFALLRSKAMPHGEIPMLREHGVWKVSALSGSELP